MQSFNVSAKKTFENKKLSIRDLAWPNGAVLTCGCGCGYQTTKTPEEMEKYLQRWPRYHGHYAQVKPL